MFESLDFLVIFLIQISVELHLARSLAVPSRRDCPRHCGATSVIYHKFKCIYTGVP